MNLKRTRGDLFLRRKKHVQTVSTGRKSNDWGNSSNKDDAMSSQQVASDDRLSKRAELLSQLPASTKVETVLKIEPTESSHNKNANSDNTSVENPRKALAEGKHDILSNSTQFSYSSKVGKSSYVIIC